VNASITWPLALVYVLSELALTFKRRAKTGESRDEDRGSLTLIWTVIVSSAALAVGAAYVFPAAAMVSAAALRVVGVALFWAGLIVRWYAIIHLGRYFTVDVAIAANHRLIATGPYRVVRHPSYAGALMAFLGLALCRANWASLVVLIVPIFLVFLRRMRIEETALLRAFGDQYRDYMNRTKRLVPAVY